MFREAGPVALLALGLFFMPGLPIVIAQALLGHRVSMAPGACVAAALPLAAGAYGYHHVTTLVDAAVRSIHGVALDPTVSARIRAQGHHEAIQNLVIGGTLTTVLVVLLSGALALNAVRRRNATGRA